MSGDTGESRQPRCLLPPSMSQMYPLYCRTSLDPQLRSFQYPYLTHPQYTHEVSSSKQWLLLDYCNDCTSSPLSQAALPKVVQSEPHLHILRISGTTGEEPCKYDMLSPAKLHLLSLPSRTTNLGPRIQMMYMLPLSLPFFKEGILTC